jgi:hypothetical protein
MVAVVLVVGLAFGSVSWADEIIEFQNGTYMTVESHRIVDGMVHVVFGLHSTMAFPQSMILDIQRGGVSVLRIRNTPNVVNRGATQYAGKVSLNSAPRSSGYRVYGSPPVRTSGTSRSARRRAMLGGDPAELLLQQAEDDLAPESASMFAGHESASHRSFGVTGNSSLTGGHGFRPGEPGQEPEVIQGQAPPRRRGGTLQPRAVPLPTHPTPSGASRND